MRGCLNCDPARPKPKPIRHTYEELVRAGFRWIETRKCKLCGVFIEVWATEARTLVALEVRPDEEWKHLPHVYYCRGERKPKLVPQTELQFTLWPRTATSRR